MGKQNLYSSLPVYDATYQLLLEVYKIQPVLSRDVRYTIGQGLTKLLMNILVTIYEANIAREKHPLLMRGRKLSVEVKVTLRILCDLKQISEKQYVRLIDMAESVSKQLTSWDNSLGKSQQSNVDASQKEERAVD